jgi:OsmC-like protein
MTDSPHRALVSVRVSSKSDESVAFFARSQQGVVGKGWSFDIAEPQLTGAEHLLAALAADALGLFRRVCRQRRLGIDQLEATVQAEMADPLVHLGVIGTTGEPRYTTFSLRAFVESPAPAAELRGAWTEALSRSPLLNTLRRSAEVTCELIFS